MMKGGRQAKLLAKENQAKRRAEKIFASFKKESLHKLKDQIMPIESKTPGPDIQTDHNFTENIEGSKIKFSKTFTSHMKKKSKYI